MQFQTSIIIKEAVAQVYQYTLNPQNMSKWVQGFQQFKTRKGRKRAKGSTAVQVFNDGGEVTEVQEEVLENITNQNFAFRLSHKNMESEVHYHFLDQGDRTTKLMVKAKVRLKPPVFNMFALFVKGPMKRQQVQDLAKLKKLLERNRS